MKSTEQKARNYEQTLRKTTDITDVTNDVMNACTHVCSTGVIKL